MEIRIRENGKVVSEKTFCEMYSNISFPQPLPAGEIILADNPIADVVISIPPPPILRYQSLIKDGIELVDGQWQTKWLINPLSDEAISLLLSQEKSLILTKIDEEVDSVYAAVIGNRGSEYTLAEAEAINFRNNSYIGRVPDSIQSWASAKKQTPQWAADNIISTASQWRVAQATIRTARLGYKEDVRACSTLDELEVVHAGWVTFLGNMQAQLGLSSARS